MQREVARLLGLLFVIAVERSVTWQSLSFCASFVQREVSHGIYISQYCVEFVGTFGHIRIAVERRWLGYAETEGIALLSLRKSVAIVAISIIMSFRCVHFALSK